MPKGTRHVEAGTLRSNHFGFVLEMDGGGFWALELWSVQKPQRYFGQRVKVEGTRVGFNILDVDRMWPEGEPRPLTWFETLKAWSNRWRNR